MPDFLFCYGTLQPGLAPPDIAPLVDQCKVLGRGFINGTLYDLGGYPGAVAAKAVGKIWGTVIEIPADPAFLLRLDEYEECKPSDPDASQYVRRMEKITLSSAHTLEAWVYFYNRDPGSARVIENGDFATHIQQ